MGDTAAEEPHAKRLKTDACDKRYKNTPFDMTGKVVLVTGGSKGLGLAMARGFAEAGANVVISARHQDQLEAAADEVKAGLDIRVLPLVADMSKRDSVQALATKSLSEMGRIDVLINNAGTN